MEKDKGLKIAVSGKGGVGKTTLSSLFCYLYARDGQRVLAVDADPDANLGTALGFSQQDLEGLTPIGEDRHLIKERTGAEPGTMGQMFALNPKVDDIPEKYALEMNGIRLLRMGEVKTGGGGCVCPESTLLKHLLKHLVLKRSETVIVDMEAGLEHLARGTAEAVDAFIVVVEPGRRSFQTAQSVAKLAEDIGVNQVCVVANKISPGQEKAVAEAIDFLPFLGVLPYSEQAVEADLAGKTVFESGSELLMAARVVKSNLEKILSR